MTTTTRITDRQLLSLDAYISIRIDALRQAGVEPAPLCSLLAMVRSSWRGARREATALWTQISADPRGARALAAAIDDLYRLTAERLADVVIASR